MLNFFKNSKATQARPAQTPVLIKTSSTTNERRLVSRPLPAPEVIEGSEESDWSLWQESVAFHDSQLQAPWPATEPGPLHKAVPSMESAAIDPFASVHKNSS